MRGFALLNVLLGFFHMIFATTQYSLYPRLCEFVGLIFTVDDMGGLIESRFEFSTRGSSAQI